MPLTKFPRLVYLARATIPTQTLLLFSDGYLYAFTRGFKNKSCRTLFKRGIWSETRLVNVSFAYRTARVLCNTYQFESRVSDLKDKGATMDLIHVVNRNTSHYQLQNHVFSNL